MISSAHSASTTNDTITEGWTESSCPNPIHLTITTATARDDFACVRRDTTATVATVATSSFFTSAPTFLPTALTLLATTSTFPTTTSTTAATTAPTPPTLTPSSASTAAFATLSVAISASTKTTAFGFTNAHFGLRRGDN